jgi:hypothetical protein
MRGQNEGREERVDEKKSMTRSKIRRRKKGKHGRR